MVFATADSSKPTISPQADAPASPWLVGPWFDALLIANIAWPLVLFAQLGEGFYGGEGVQFWQLYFITTPHRWITLFIVFLDRERFRERKVAFVALAAGFAAICLGVRLTTGTLTCLLTIDYVWNAWHFASQHHGIYRIYARRSPPAPTTAVTIEKWLMRAFLLYVILRVAGATWPHAAWEAGLQRLDWAVLAVPAWLVVKDFMSTRSGSSGRRLYLVSVCALYVSLLAAVHLRQPALILSLATASALFHAIEYLALVSWATRQRHAARPAQMGLLGNIAARWLFALAGFVLILGAAGWLLDQHLMQSWLLLNVIVAFLHYAYDGLIWRQRGARK